MLFRIPAALVTVDVIFPHLSNEIVVHSMEIFASFSSLRASFVCPKVVFLSEGEPSLALCQILSDESDPMFF